MWKFNAADYTAHRCTCGIWRVGKRILGDSGCYMRGGHCLLRPPAAKGTDGSTRLPPETNLSRI